MRQRPEANKVGGGAVERHHRLKLHFCSFIPVLVFTLQPGSGWSASALVAGEAGGNSSILEEVLVTARRREEQPLDVPMALTYLDGATLDGLQYRDLAAIVSLSPGVVAYTGNNSPQIAIRGVVAPGNLSETGNAIYVDEVYISGLVAVLPGVYDLQSVQVLKGPQAGLYGRNTTGGAVLITTAQPTDERFGRLDTSYAQEGEKNANSTVNLPLSDSVRLRATGWYSDIDGGYYQGGVIDQNLDSSSETGGRLTVALLPNEHTALTLTGEFADITASHAGFIGVVEGAQLGPAPLAPESRRNVLRDDLGDIDQDAGRVNAKLDIDTRLGTFISVAAWRKVTLNDPGSDADGTAYSASYADYLADPATWDAVLAPQVASNDIRDTSRSADLRFLTPDNNSPVRVMIGTSYFEETVRIYDQTIPVRDFAQILAAEHKDGSATASTGQETTSWAGFTELTWTPAEPVEITADLRYTHDRKDLRYIQSATGFYTQLTESDFALDTGKTFENWSPGITLAYKPDETLTVFAKYVRGFRAGGFNAPVNNPAYLSYDSEEAENYELGFKSLLFDQRLNLGASVFYLRLNNAVLPQVDFGPLGLFTPIINAGVSESTGLEIDLTAQVTDGLSLIASGGAYQNSLSEGGVLSLSQRPFAPDYTASFAADYQRPLSGTLTAFARAGFRHRSGGILPGNNLDMDSYNLLDVQFGTRFKQVEFGAFVRNALDDHYLLHNNGLLGIQGSYVEAPGSRALVPDPGSVFGLRITIVI